MKKSILKVIYLFLGITLLVGVVTFFIQDVTPIQKDGREEFLVNVINNKVEYPQESSLGILNYNLSKFYSVFRLILSVLLPILYYKIFKNFIKDYEKKEKGDLKELITLIISYTLFVTVLTLPISFFSGFYRTKIIGLSNMTLNTWIFEYVKNIIIDIGISLILYYIPYKLYKKSKRWSLYVALLYGGFIFLSSYIGPIFIDPILENIKPLEDGNIKSSIEELCYKANINDLHVYVIEKGNKTNAINAYMTGIFGSKRIVLWDTTMKAINNNELMAVVAHEMGHYKMNHIEKSLIISFITMILSLCIFQIIINKKKFKRNMSTMLIILIINSFFNLVITPIDNYISRKMEYDSDKFAIDITGDKVTSAVLEAKLMHKNAGKLDVDLWYKIMFCDHPTTKERIDAANNYKN